MNKLTPEQITQRLNEIYKPITYRREMDYFSISRTNESLNLGSSVPWLKIEAPVIVKFTIYSGGTNGSCMWSMLAHTLADFYPNWRSPINGMYMVYSPHVWKLYQQSVAEYFKITNRPHFEKNYPIFMGKFISENHKQILEYLYDYHDKTEVKPEVVKPENWFTRIFNKIIGK